MTNGHLFSGAFTVILVTAGCVGVPDFSQSDRCTFEKASRIITEGRIGLSDFDAEQRLLCARNLTDADIIIDTLEVMSHLRRDSAASSKINAVLSGMNNDLNAAIVKTLLANLGANKDAFDILTRGDICFAPRVYGVVVGYCESCVGEINDQPLLCRMSDKFSNWRNLRCSYGQRGVAEYKLQKELYERILPRRHASLVSNVAEVRDFFASNDSISEADKRTALCGVKDQQSLVPLVKDNWIGRLAVDAITDQQLLSEIARDKSLDDETRLVAVNRIDNPMLLSEIAMNEEEYAWWSFKEPKVGLQALVKIGDSNHLLRVALLAGNNAVSSKAKRMLGDGKAFADGILTFLARNEISESRAACHIEKFAEGEATLDLYKGVGGRLKRLVLSKLSLNDRRAARADESALCDRIVANARARAKCTFEIGGFSIGMRAEDAFTLLGHYYPDIIVTEKEDNGGVSFLVPFQGREFCRLGKDDKVCLFNFGESILRKMCRYDAQDEQEWAMAFSRERCIDMRHILIEKDATMMDVDAGVGFSGKLTVKPRYNKAHLRQDVWQYKDKVRNCVVCYFGKPIVRKIGDSGLVEAIAPGLLQKWLDNSFKDVSFPSGTLQIRANND